MRSGSQLNLSDSEKVQIILQILSKATSGLTEPMSLTIVKVFGRDPFLILVSCLLSLRARDTMTLPICIKLFQRYKTPQDFILIPTEELEKHIFSIGYYRQKAAQIKAVSNELIQRFNSQVPDNEDDLLSIKGIGRKTATLVLSIGFEQKAICVDIHVHRISNRLGIVSTKTPHETETALQLLVPKDQWSEINRLFVILGQNICLPISPKCSICPLNQLCPMKGVDRFR